MQITLRGIANIFPIIIMQFRFKKFDDHIIGRNVLEAKIHTVPSIYIFDKEVATNACEFQALKLAEILRHKHTTRKITVVR